MVAAPLCWVTLLLSAALSTSAAPHKRAETPLPDGYWVSTGEGLYLPGHPLPNNGSSTTPAPSLDVIPLPSTSPTTTTTTTSAPADPLITALVLSPELRALVRRGALVTADTPGQSARLSAIAASKASVTSSMRAAGTCKVTSDCVTTAPANANTYCDDGVCSYRCMTGFQDNGSACVAASTSITTPAATTIATTTTVAAVTTTTAKITTTAIPSTTTTTTTTTTSAAPATQTCSLTSDCANTVPANANRYCDSGVCGYRCRSGFVASGSACVAASTTTTTTTTSTTTTTPATTTTTTSAAATQTCSLTSDCANTVPANANRYCDSGICSYRCRSGYSASGSECVVTSTATTTTTSTAAVSTQTCAATADCTNTVPAYANRYCDSGVCSFRCRYGYTESDGSCVFTGLGGSNGTTWTESSDLTTLAEFKSDVINSGVFSWGESQGSVALLPNGVPASNWTDGVQGDSEPALQVRYPAGSRNPSATPVGGMGFYTSQIDVSTATNVSFSYSVFFEDGFDFVKGGKLPGLYGGSTACSGGSTAETCFSARLMFRTGGMGELYLYAPREKQVDALCELPPLSYCNSVYGMSIGRGSWTFKTGEWTDIRQDIWLNTPGVADGGFNIWVNGELVLSSSEVYYRNSAVGNIGTGSSNTTVMTLIDYDALPDTVVIPNGGFKPSNETGVFNPSFVTKIVGPTVTATTPGYENSFGEITATSLPFDWEARRRRRRNVVPLVTPTPTPTPTPGTTLARRMVALKKRADTVAITVPNFLGAMCQTFFGGSSSDYNSPTLQYSYFRGFGLTIND